MEEVLAVLSPRVEGPPFRLQLSGLLGCSSSVWPKPQRSPVFKDLNHLSILSP